MSDDKTKKPLTDEQLDEASGGVSFEKPFRQCRNPTCQHAWDDISVSTCPKCGYPYSGVVKPHH
jgi:hypothetical protein